jgi:hypothetical protein
MTTILSGSIDPAALRATLERIYAGSAFLRAKQDVRETPFLEYAAVPAEEIVRVHPSSGTTGRRTVCPYTAKDVDDWADLFARCYSYAGVGVGDACRSPLAMACGPPAWVSRPAPSASGSSGQSAGPSSRCSASRRSTCLASPSCGARHRYRVHAARRHSCVGRPLPRGDSRSRDIAAGAAGNRGRGGRHDAHQAGDTACAVPHARSDLPLCGPVRVRQSVPVHRADGRPGLSDALGKQLHNKIGLRIDVDLVPLGALPRTERKTQRVFDRREL